VTNQGASEFAKTITDSSVVVLDVRTPGEFMTGHITNAINIDVEGMQFNSEVSRLDKSKTYAVYCHSGRRSGIATAEMSKLGFKTLFNLEGGIGAWSAAGQTLVTN
jgi:rhodanese-related sulfurtransferase